VALILLHKNNKEISEKQLTSNKYFIQYNLKEQSLMQRK